ncbi:MAG: rhodanese-like domain-containing protein [Bacteroidota bacterium]
MIYDKIITPGQLKEKLADEDELFIVDTRENTSVLKPIDSAIQIPASKILEKLDTLSKEKTIILYCSHGVDSFFLMNILVTKYGYTDVYSLKTGLDGWYRFLESE